MKKRPLPPSFKFPKKTLWQHHTELVAAVEKMDKKNDFTPKQLQAMSNSEFFKHFGFSKRKLPSLERLNKYSLLAIEAKKRALKNLKIKQEREKRVVSMILDNGMTLQKVGDVLGVSRERVRQIIIRLEKREGIKIARPGRGAKKPPVLVATRCIFCNSIVEVAERQYKHNKPTKTYRCKEHKHILMRSKRILELCPEWPTMSNGQKQKWRYDNDPEWRAKHAAAVKKYHDSIKNDPVNKAKLKEYNKEYVARKLAEDPLHFKKKSEEYKARKKASEAARLTELRARMGLIHSDKNDDQV